MTTFIQLPVENGGGGGGGGGGSAYWGDAVPTFSLLGVGAVDGEVKLVLDTNSTYRWNGGLSQWAKVDNYLGSLAGGQALVSTAGGITESAVTSAQLANLVGTLAPIQGQINGRVAKAGDTMSGYLTLNADPTNALHAASKQYVDAADGTLNTAISGKVSKAGDTMTGLLVLSADPSAALGAATKQYVDSANTAQDTVINGKVAKAGDTMTGALTLNANPTLNLHAATKQYVDTNTANKLPLAGGTMTGNLILDHDPTQALEAATKQYVDGVAQGLNLKDAVHAASTANIPSLSGLLTIDGHLLQDQQRVLVKNQDTPADNGIYVASSGPWARSSDMNSWAEVPSAFTFVEQGNTQKDTGWVCTSDEGGTLGITAITWTQFSGAGQYAADGQGLELDGNVFKLELDGATLAKSGTGLKISDGGVSDTQIAGAAAISLSKLAALTASKALVSNASGVVAASSVTATELGYVSGVTSAIQTQIDGKQPTGNYVTALTGDVTASGPGSAAATVANVGGKTAAQVSTSVDDTLNATSAATASRIMKRDASANVNVATLIAESKLMVGQNATPAGSAALEISSTTGALLMPRMSTAQRDALTGVNGMVIYNSSTDRFEGYVAGAWTPLHGWGY
jgi:hypothetical protein